MGNTERDKEREGGQEACLENAVGTGTANHPETNRIIQFHSSLDLSTHPTSRDSLVGYRALQEAYDGTLTLATGTVHSTLPEEP
jgi:hypothetical protein